MDGLRISYVPAIGVSAFWVGSRRERKEREGDEVRGAREEQIVAKRAIVLRKSGMGDSKSPSACSWACFRMKSLIFQRRPLDAAETHTNVLRGIYAYAFSGLHSIHPDRRKKEKRLFVFQVSLPTATHLLLWLALFAQVHVSSVRTWI